MAGYSGYLIKVLKVDENGTDYVIPMHYVVENTYKMTYSVMDVDSTRNAEGKLIRNAMPHRVPHCKIHVRRLNNSQLADLMSNIQSRYVIAKEKKVNLSVFVPEINDYVEDEFYVPDIELTINHIQNNTVKYDYFDLEFIGY